MSELPPNFRPDAFAGTVEDYVRYRPPYDARLIAEMLDRADLPATDARLIDLACGAGRLTFAIADRFADVLAIDQEPAMIAAAEREAERLGVTNIRWEVGRAEDVEVTPASLDLVTAASAFHRFDQRRVAALAFGWLKPGGALVTMGDIPAMSGRAEWRPAVADVVRAYVGQPVQRLQGAPNPTTEQALADEEALLRRVGFVDVASHNFETPHVWPLESLLGNLRSTSFASRAALGDRHAAFEADLTAALLAFDPSGRYPEVLGSGYTLARKP
jgi:2-polyprenyl-3-methyl-5-hydroxy-6-metoxy-1,4-benzoquinol methylase